MLLAKSSPKCLWLWVLIALFKDEQTRTMMLGLQQVVRELGVEADVLLVDVRKRKDVNKLVKRILFSDKLFAV